MEIKSDKPFKVSENDKSMNQTYIETNYKGDTFYYSDAEKTILHREDGPAIEYANGRKDWFLNGQRHRCDGPAIEDPDGYKCWFLNDYIHRENGPAVEWSDGHKDWYLNGERHREDGPAIECVDGRKEWYRNGKLHRNDGPAIEYVSGRKEWFINGELHRNDGPAIEDSDGHKEWYLNSERHREDGPAVEYVDGRKDWYLYGKRHREDGPAIEFADGIVGYYVDNKPLTKEEFDARQSRPIELADLKTECKNLRHLVKCNYAAIDDLRGKLAEVELERDCAVRDREASYEQFRKSDEANLILTKALAQQKEICDFLLEELHKTWKVMWEKEL